MSFFYPHISMERRLPIIDLEKDGAGGCGVSEEDADLCALLGVRDVYEAKCLLLGVDGDQDARHGEIDVRLATPFRHDLNCGVLHSEELRGTHRETHGVEVWSKDHLPTLRGYGLAVARHHKGRTAPHAVGFTDLAQERIGETDRLRHAYSFS